MRKRDKLSIKATEAASKRMVESMDMGALRLFLDAQDAHKFQALFGMMCDPSYQKLNFSSLLKRAHVSIHEVQQIYTDGMRHLGLMKMMNALPDIMSDVAEDARNTTQPCPRCDATGSVPLNERGYRSCPLCEGEGVVKKMGDKHARDLVFESAKLTGQATPTVAIQTNISLGDAKLEDMLKRTRSIVLDKAIEAEVVSSDGENKA
jgi:hypothetical protein